MPAFDLAEWIRVLLVSGALGEGARRQGEQGKGGDTGEGSNHRPESVAASACTFGPVERARESAPPVVAPPPGHRRFPLFDSLRAIAALGVLVAHAGYVAGAIQHAEYGPFVANLSAGVTLFFVISGFLLYRPFVASDLLALERPTPLDFYRRRVLRIVPAYWVALTILAIYPGLVGVFTGKWPWFYFFAQVYGPDRTTVEGLAFAWSLNVEVMFYALLPLYAWGVRKLTLKLEPALRVRLELIALAVLAAASVGLRVWDVNAGGSALQVTLATTFLWFALGMGLAVVSAWLERARTRPAAVRLIERRPGLAWAAAGTVYVLLAIVVSTDPGQELVYTDSQWLAQHLLAGAVAFLLVLPAVFGDDRGGATRAVLAFPALAWLGLVSYGVYLWQGGAIQALADEGVLEWAPGSRFIVMTAVALIATVVCAALSYYLVERSFLRLKYPRRTRRGGRPAAPPAAVRAE